MGKQSKYKLQRGDVLYQASKSYKRVFKWTIVDIFVEDYLSGGKVIFVVENEVLGRVQKFMSDVMYWYETEAEAQEFLDEELMT